MNRKLLFVDNTIWPLRSTMESRIKHGSISLYIPSHPSWDAVCSCGRNESCLDGLYPASLLPPEVRRMLPDTILPSDISCKSKNAMRRDHNSLQTPTCMDSLKHGFKWIYINCVAMPALAGVKACLAQTCYEQHSHWTKTTAMKREQSTKIPRVHLHTHPIIDEGRAGLPADEQCHKADAWDQKRRRGHPLHIAGSNQHPIKRWAKRIQWLHNSCFSVIKSSARRTSISWLNLNRLVS